MGEAKSSSPPRHRLVVGIVIAIALVGLVVAILDWHKVSGILGHTNWSLVPFALLFTGVSYACLSSGFAITNRVFGIRLPARDLLEIGFISTVLNHLLSAGGAAGYSVRFLLMGGRGATLKDILAASLFNSYLDMLGMMAVLPVGLIYLLVRHPLSRAASVTAAVGAAVLLIAFVVANLLVFSSRLRGPILRRLGRLARPIIRRDITSSFEEFDATVTRGVDELRRRPWLFVLLAALVVLDWSASMVAVWFCFDALGTRLHLGVLVTGFTISVTAGVLSMVPGGFGVQDASMAGLYALLGAPLEQAALAAVLFRVVYYLVPYVVSLVFYYRHLRQLRTRSGNDRI